MSTPQEYLLRAVKAFRRQLVVITPAYTILASKDDANGPKENTMVGQLCHQSLFHRSSPCHGCPVVEVLQTGQSAMSSDSERLMKDENESCFYAYPIFENDADEGNIGLAVR